MLLILRTQLKFISMFVIGGGERGCSFEHAVLSSYAADGGLFVPESVPLFTVAFLKKLLGKPFGFVVAEVCAFISPHRIVPEHSQFKLARSCFSILGTRYRLISYMRWRIVHFQKANGPKTCYRPEKANRINNRSIPPNAHW